MRKIRLLSEPFAPNSWQLRNGRVDIWENEYGKVTIQDAFSEGNRQSKGLEIRYVSLEFCDRRITRILSDLDTSASKDA
jgi:hypothetical protein